MDYRLYFLDAQGHIVSFKELQGDNDEAAISIAATHRAKQKLELWQGSQLLAKFDPLKDERT